MMRHVPWIGLAALGVIGVGWRSWLQRRRYGSSGIFVFRSRDTGQRVRDAVVPLLIAVVVIQAMAYSLWPYTIAMKMLVRPFNVLGTVAIAGGIALLARAQLDLGASWRIGIEKGASPGVVTTGLYRWTRNPIFTAMCVALGGVTLLIPTWVSLATFAGCLMGVWL